MDRADWVWVEDRGLHLTWRLLPEGTGRRCRFGAAPRRPACGALAAAELNRGRRTILGHADQWWPYCKEHLYGRKIEDGKILILVSPDSPAAHRAQET